MCIRHDLQYLQFLQWIQPILDLYNGSVLVCGFPAGAQENWLIAQHISRVVSGGQRLSKVTAQFEVTLNGCDTSRQCRQSYDVYIWQTSTINRTAARNTDNYMFIERISPDNTDGYGSSTNLVEIDLNSEDGFYLAVVDFSTCLTVNRILVFYYVCPEETSQLISLPETIESLEGSATSVNGECVENSSTESGTSPSVQCGNMGQWQVMVPCLCNPGYELNDTQDQCTGTKLSFNTCLSTSADLYIYMYSSFSDYCTCNLCSHIDVDVYAPSHCPYIPHTFTCTYDSVHIYWLYIYLCMCIIHAHLYTCTDLHINILYLNRLRQ